MVLIAGECREPRPERVAERARIAERPRGPVILGRKRQGVRDRPVLANACLEIPCPTHATVRADGAW